ncbi:MAG: LamG domain-containing protein [Cyanobacteria bacterium P01_G01_bin.54]
MSGCQKQDVSADAPVVAEPLAPIPLLVDARSFDGIGEFLELPNQDDLNVETGDFSLSFWIKTDVRSGIQVIVDKRVETSGPVKGYVVANYNGQLLLQLADGLGKEWTNYISSVAIADNQWHHVVITVDRQAEAGIRWYLDGREAGEPANPKGRPQSLSNSQPLTIGRRSDHPSWPGYFQGQLAQIYLFQTVLTPEQVQQRMSQLQGS